MLNKVKYERKLKFYKDNYKINKYLTKLTGGARPIDFGEQYDDMIIKKPISSGGFGIVYHFDENIVVKFIRLPAHYNEEKMLYIKKITQFGGYIMNNMTTFKLDQDIFTNKNGFVKTKDNIFITGELLLFLKRKFTHLQKFKFIVLKNVSIKEVQYNDIIGDFDSKELVLGTYEREDDNIKLYFNIPNIFKLL